MGGRPGKEGRGVLLAGEGVGRRGGELADGERGGGVWGGWAGPPPPAGRPSPAPECGVGRPAAFFLSFCPGVCGWELLSKATAPAEVPALRSLPFYIRCL